MEELLSAPLQDVLVPSCSEEKMLIVTVRPRVGDKNAQKGKQKDTYLNRNMLKGNRKGLKNISAFWEQ